MIRHVIFDMDGTLVDNTAAHLEAFRRFGRRYGVELTEHHFQNLFGMGNDDILRSVLPSEVVRRRGLTALAAEKEALYRSLYAPDIAPIRGLIDLLEALRARGIPCAVGSSGPALNVQFVVERCGLAPYFAVRVSGDAVRNAKPAPDIYLEVAARLGADPAACLVFEDSANGIRAAYAAGMQAAAITTTLRAEELRHLFPDLRAVVDDFTRVDLPTLLGA